MPDLRTDLLALIEELERWPKGELVRCEKVALAMRTVLDRPTEPRAIEPAPDGIVDADWALARVHPEPAQPPRLVDPPFRPGDPGRSAAQLLADLTSPKPGEDKQMAATDVRPGDIERWMWLASAAAPRLPPGSMNWPMMVRSLARAVLLTQAPLRRTAPPTEQGWYYARQGKSPMEPTQVARRFTAPPRLEVLEAGNWWPLSSYLWFGPVPMPEVEA